MVQKTHSRNLLTALYETPVGRIVALGTVASAIALAATLSGALPRSRPEINLPSISRPVDSSQNTGQTIVDAYYAQARSAILQDVPDLADAKYKSALDYTAQRMTDMKNVYGLSLDEVRAPVAKWVQANVDWDNKGERLVPLSEKDLDFIPDTLLMVNFSLTPGVERVNTETLVDQMIAQHDQIWAELRDPAKMENYLNEADIVTIWWTKQEATKYKSAIRQHGTFADKAHWALVGKAYARPIKNEEITRNEQPLAYVLAVGGQAQIAQNHTVTLSTGGSRGDRQLAIRISKQLQDAINADPATYGHPIDSGYLQPNLPNRESVDKTLEVSGGKIAMPVVYRGAPDRGNTYGKNTIWLVGDEPTARKYSLN